MKESFNIANIRPAFINNLIDHGYSELDKNNILSSLPDNLTKFASTSKSLDDIKTIPDKNGGHLYFKDNKRIDIEDIIDNLMREAEQKGIKIATHINDVNQLGINSGVNETNANQNNRADKILNQKRYVTREINVGKGQATTMTDKEKKEKMALAKRNKQVQQMQQMQLQQQQQEQTKKQTSSKQDDSSFINWIIGGSAVFFSGLAGIAGLSVGISESTKTNINGSIAPKNPIEAQSKINETSIESMENKKEEQKNDTKKLIEKMNE